MILLKIVKGVAQYKGGGHVANDKESSIASLVTVLQAVQGIAKVGRQFKTFEEIAEPEFPYVAVEEEESGEVSVIHTSGGFVNVTFVANVIGYVNASKNLATQLNNLDKLVNGALGADFTAMPRSDSIMRSAGLIGFIIQPLSRKTGTEFNPYAAFTRPVELEFQAQVSEGF